MNSILQATVKIQKEYPEHYRYLSETPLFLFDQKHSINRLDFEHYLESLLMQLDTFKKASSKHPDM